jgi:hypothetical protein
MAEFGLSLGCRCCGCPSLYLGFLPTPPNLLSGTVGQLITDADLLQQSLDNASLAGHSVTVANDNPRNYKLPPSGRWAAKKTGPVFGAVYNFQSMYLPNSGVDVEYVWAPEGATGDDIFADESLSIRLTTPISSLFYDFSATSDWDDENYAHGIGSQTFHQVRRDISFYVGVMRDSISGVFLRTGPGAFFPFILAYPTDTIFIGGTSVRAASFHRPIKHEIPRRLHIINHMDTDWHFDGLSMWGVIDDRSPDRNQAGNCPRIFLENRATVNNQPFLIDATLSDVFAGEGRNSSIRRGGDSQWGSMAEDVNRVYNFAIAGQSGRSLAVGWPDWSPRPPLANLGFANDGDVLWADAIDANVSFRVEFGPTQIISLAANSQPATVLCECNLKVFSRAWVPGPPSFGLTSYVSHEVMTSETDISFEFEAWDRGQMPDITIFAGVTENTVTANGFPGTSNTWHAPYKILKRKLVFNSSQGWLPQDEYETQTFERKLVLRNADIL